MDSCMSLSLCLGNGISMEPTSDNLLSGPLKNYVHRTFMVTCSLQPAADTQSSPWRASRTSYLNVICHGWFCSSMLLNRQARLPVLSDGLEQP